MLRATRDCLLVHKRRIEEARVSPLPPVPPLATFKLRFSLPLLKDYSSSVFPAIYWAKWIKRSLHAVLPGSSWVSSSALRDLARRANFQHTAMLDKVCKRLNEGANGCEGRGRIPT